VAGAVLVLLLIYGSLMPGSALPDTGVSDKTEHFSAYLLLAVWFGGLYSTRTYPVLAVGLLLLGGGIEIAQGLMGLGRTADFADFLADGAGVALGLVLCFLGLSRWPGWFQRRKRRR
jgi:VanZ family protein